MTGLKEGDALKGFNDVYQITGRLSRGGFGITYHAIRQSDQQEVLVKELRFERLQEWKSLELFEREARILRTLKHSAIPACHDYFAFDGEKPLSPGKLAGEDGAGVLPLYFVEEYVNGPSFGETIQEGRRFSAEELENLLRKLLDVLHYLHTLNPPVIHRDIKPDNIILDKEGNPHLIDFGAIQDRFRGESRLGSTNVGTFGYLPLEQVMGKARPASDLYALGMTLLALLTHREPEHLPVDEATGKIALEAVPEIPPALLGALDGMIEPIAANRLSSAMAVLELLDNPDKQRPLPAARTAPGNLVSFRRAWIWSGALVLTGIVLFIEFVYAKLSPRELKELSIYWVVPLVFALSSFLADRLLKSKRLALTTLLLMLALGVPVALIYIFLVF